MQIYLDIFLAFFIPNIVGYGGGPAIIPLIEAQVVGQYGWMNANQFAEVLALGNACQVQLRPRWRVILAMKWEAV
ncbi:chromate transporter [Vibrio ishigakensis]|uniref:Chromate transporter n=1 Tax=Vibrio ishigakensis TaxID=1481914 RepID=A0A0B8QP13_9VIBR|nr:chromate transporter [Vibrio ishigakensis]